VVPGRLKSRFEMETVVRLGEGLKKTGVISTGAMQRGYETLKEYLGYCRTWGVHDIFAVGTSVLRDARNSGEFCGRVQEGLGLDIDVISGEEEASLSYLAVVRNARGIAKPVLVVDVGGGSTEFILGAGERVLEWVSLPLGLVGFTEQLLISDPVREGEWDRMADVIRASLSEIPHPSEPFSMVSVGGTGTTLASVQLRLKDFVSERTQHFILSKEAIQNQLSLYRSKTLEERKAISGLPSDRADVILAGGTILSLAMEELRCPSVRISTHGVRYGLLYKRLHS
jgi:exopolyphosphatase/guanosine-5'-triphosphate,3'-diphosphate pyrophosphatase